MPLGRANSRWIRAAFFGVLAEVCTGVLVILVVATHSIATGGPMVDTTSTFYSAAGAWVGIVGGGSFVYLFSRWIGRFLARAFIAHGLVVAGVAVLLHVVSSVASLHSFDLVHASADVLKLAAGALAGWQAARQR
jgi:hypothetical protein